MTLVALCEAPGSSASTTTALALAALAPTKRPTLVLECDPSGGDLAGWAGLHGNPSWSSAVSAPDRSWSGLYRHLQELPSALNVMLAPSSPSRSASVVADAADRFAPMVSALDDVVAFADCGRAVGRSGSALAVGSYTEIRVHHRELPLMGIIDHLHVMKDGSRVTDFKTGSPAASHMDQLLTYGVLWRSDARNAQPEAPMTVVAEYGDHRAEHLADAAELDRYESTVAVQIRSAEEQLANNPIATLDPDVCVHCEVRHLCDDYWSDVATAPLPEIVGDPLRRDVTGVIVERRSASAFGIRLPDGSVASLFATGLEIEEGQELRACDLLCVSNERTETEGAVLQATSATEIFVLRTT